MHELPSSVVLEAWKNALGGDGVLSAASDLGRYAQNVSGLAREVPAAVRPGCTEEVVEVVRIARDHKVPLYPISCGKNWGLGSALPPIEGATILDLSRMNKIREVDVSGQYAVVEAGVTQGQLYDYLQERSLPLSLNVTGSGRATSLIGNALERGIGYFSSRADALSGLEVVLGTGEVLRTGFAHYPQARTTHLYRHGVGPSLDGLFSQSGFGVVTAAGIQLMPQHQHHAAVIMKIDLEEALADFVDALATLRRNNIITTVVHIGNRNRTVSTLAPLVAEYLAARSGFKMSGEMLRAEAEAAIEQEGFGPWSGVVGIMGTKGHISEVVKQVRASLKGIASVLVLNDRKFRLASQAARLAAPFSAARGKLALFHAMQPLYGLSKGIPTDAPLKSVGWPVGEEWLSGDVDPDQGRSGMLYCLPFIPMDGRVAREAMERTDAVFAKHGFIHYTTLNIVDSRVFECVINLAFDRTNSERVTAAHACIEELQKEFIDAGYIPYRVGIQSMGQVVSEDDLFWRTARDLKRVVDPGNIIAPGRYNLE